MRKLVIYAVFIMLACSLNAYASERLNPYPIPEFRQTQRESLHSDFFLMHFWQQLERPFYLDRVIRRLSFRRVEARNVDELGKVADSSFFVNRIGTGNWSPDQTKRGNVDVGGPDTSGKLTILKAKSSGLSAGLIVKDQIGNKYLIKFDLQGYPELMSAAEVIGARLFYALGYHVPEYTITRFRFDQLEINPGIKYYDSTGFLKDLDEDGLRWLLRNASIDANQQYRASASLFLEGKILGPMSLTGRRHKDPQDPIRHEHRRELRGLRVFCSWLNHFDFRRGNTLDVLLQEEEGWEIRHYLLDFSGTLGAYVKGPKTPQIGREYVMDVPEVLKSFFSLGSYKRPWNYEEPISPFLGYFPNIGFNPGKWRPHMPNYPFQNMTLDDALWATDILSRVSDEDIRAAVAAGEMTNEKAIEVLCQKLIERRDAIVSYWQDRRANE